MIKTIVLTISDTRTKDTDKSGEVILNLLKERDFGIGGYEIIKDDKQQIKNRLFYYCDESGVDLILTNGGTGLGPRDVTPEATVEVIEKNVPGISELIRSEGFKKTKQAILSRSQAGVRKQTLIINLPGSPKGARESLLSILELIPHAIDMIKGKGH
ncbi:MAG: MogA/MoaB family molybdenum cofactor biosynthesis protein [Candidatus Omnitrophota bacterium]